MLTNVRIRVIKDKSLDIGSGLGDSHLGHPEYCFFAIIFVIAWLGSVNQ